MYKMMHKIFYNSHYKKLTMRTGLFCSFEKTFSYRLWSVFSRYVYLMAFWGLDNVKPGNNFRSTSRDKFLKKTTNASSVAVFWPDLIQHVKEA